MSRQLVVSEKIYTSPTEEISAVKGGGSGRNLNVSIIEGGGGHVDAMCEWLLQ